MAESLLLPVVRVAVDKTADALVQRVTRMCGVDGDRRKLERHLLAVECLLADAVAKSETNPAIKRWMNDLRAVAYKADDVLDDFRYEALRRDAVRHGGHMTMTTKIFGRDKDRESVVQLLLDQRDEKNLQVLPVVGMGGLGKTTLAKMVYNDTSVHGHFQLKMWHCASRNFQANTLVRSMVELATKERCDLPDTIELLRGRLQEVIGFKRFLLVLDDVWSEEQHNWEDNLKPLLFSLGGSGSVILVTTRSQRVASIMGTLRPINLPHLSEEHSWELFSKKAFSRDMQMHPELISIGKRIVQKCRGLPLALKTMGGLMSSKQLISEWEAIAESNIGDNVQGRNGVLAILKFSYTNLPSEIKRCFAFCAVFPKNYRMDKGTLIQLWIANGFIHEEGTTDSEEKGELIFSQLVWRSFLQVVNPTPFDNQASRYGLVGCQMHDLMHDLAKDVTDECSTLEDLVQKNASAKDVRHLKISCEMLEKTSGLFNFKATNSLRTLLSPSLSYKDLSKSRLMSLRALCCTSPNIINSHSINTKFIRYLDFSHSTIVKLPSSICMLYNLQSLRLNHCHRLQYLPEGMRTMRNLNHLYLFECDKLKRMPPNIGLLNNLHTLTAFVLDTGHGYGIAQLRDLRHLRNRLELYNLIKIESGADAREARDCTIVEKILREGPSLHQKKNLSELSLCWGRRKYEYPQYDIGSYEEVLEADIGSNEEVLEAVEPHSELKVLEVHGYGGTKFSQWMTNSQMCKCLQKLIIFNCPSCNDMPIAGLLVFLEYLSLGWMDSLTTLCKNINLDVEGCSTSMQLFPKLKIMFLENLRNLERWVESCGGELDSLVMFPQLEELSMYDCPEVASVPKCPVMKNLSVTKCQSLPISSLAHLTMLTELNYDGKSYVPTIMPLGSWHSLVNLRVSSLAKMMVPMEEKQIQRPMESLQSVRLSGPNCFVTTSTTPKFHQQVWECFSFVKELYISECNELVRWPVEELQNMPCIRFLCISCCSNLQGRISPSSEEILPLPRLEMLSIYNCTSLQDIPNLPTSLEELKISNCEGLMTLPSNLGDLAELKRLYLSGCIGLKMLPDGMEGLTSLQRLTINECPGIQRFPPGLIQWLSSLKSLKVEGCPELHRRWGVFSLGPCHCRATHYIIKKTKTRCNTKKAFLKRLLMKLISKNHCFFRWCAGWPARRLDVIRICGVDDDRCKLERHLLAVQCLLADAEAKSETNPAIKRWMKDLKAVAYEADDVLEDFHYEALRNEAQIGDSTTRKVLNYLTPQSPLLFRVSMSKKLSRVLKKINELVEEMNRFGLVTSTEPLQLPYRQTHSVLDEPADIFGRHDDKEAVVKLLLEQRYEEKLQVLPVVGMGGLGKTTLAKMVYNDPRVKEHFHLKMWHCVSENFEAVSLLQSIVELAMNERCKLKTIEMLHKKLVEVIRKKRFLLVFDDVWNEEEKRWEDDLKPLLNSVGGLGSVMVVTTRSQRVAYIMGTLEPHELACLNEDDSWELFSNRAFGREVRESAELVVMGRRIVKKCGGLPLAVKTMGGLMSSKQLVSEWKTIAESNIGVIVQAKNNVIDIMKLSYRHLSSEMKQCFAFCAVFPKNYEMDRDILIQLWMANGFIQEEDTIDLTYKGELIYHDLVWRSFLEDVKEKDADSIVCKMHDLMHDLAKDVTDECASTAEELSQVNRSANHVHHIMVSWTWGVPKEMVTELFKCSSSLRTAMLSETPDATVQELRLDSLRALSWSCTYRVEKHLSDTLSHLMKANNLRYLDLSGSCVVRLPNSMCMLYNLQTLRLDDCIRLEYLPERMGTMRMLLHIYLYGCPSLQQMPPNISLLNNLHTLTKFIVDTKAGCGIEELKDLRKLSNRLELPPRPPRSKSGLMKHYEMDKEVLIQLWMANGFIQEEETMDFQQKGDYVFKYLVGISFPQDVKAKSIHYSTTYESIGCKMHDLMHDLAKEVADECVSSEQLTKQEASTKNVQHMHISSSTVNVRQKMRLFKGSSLHTLIMPPMLDEDLKDLRLASLRALGVGEFLHYTYDIQSYVINAKHLRYLDLSLSEILMLPSTICGMYNLQTLRLNGCWRLKYLPEGLGTMKKLVHLYLVECNS
uniref:Uncharacterized protein n=1 Tax=Leersia perrieri TaxID=77586 RepID=A0A0D9XAE7_9ORYZ